MNLPEPRIIIDCVSSPYGSSLQDDNDDYLSTTANVRVSSWSLGFGWDCNVISVLYSHLSFLVAVTWRVSY